MNARHHPHPGWWGEVQLTLWLALPIMAGQVSYMLLGLADTLMVGRVGTVPMAACAFANNLLNVPLITGTGIMSAISVLAARAHGARDAGQAEAILRGGYLVAFLFGVAMVLLSYFALPLLPLLKQPPEVLKEVPTYYLLMAVTMIPAFLGSSAKSYCESQNKPWPTLYITLLGVPMNVALNWVLIYGNCGAPALGLEGAGWATLISRCSVALGCMAYARHLSQRLRREESGEQVQRQKVTPELLRNILAIGWPVSLQLSAEVLGFGVASLMVGWIGVAQIAAHQIALCCAATTFMVPLGLSMAVTIRVGHVIGAGQPQRAGRIAFGAAALACCIMGTSALIMATCAPQIAALFTADVQVQKIAVGMLGVAALFQVVDGLQVVFMGGLRGLADVRVPLALAFTAYWAVALPLGYWLAFAQGLGARGIWFGLASGLGFAALMLGLRLWSRIRILKAPTCTLPPSATT